MKRLGAAYIRKAARADAQIAKSLAEIRRAGSTCVTQLDFRSFIRRVMPSYRFYAWTELLIDALEEVVAGTMARLIVQVPPRHGKSLLISRLFPAYYLLRHQDRFVAVTSYGATLAEGFSRSARHFYLEAGGQLDPAAQSVKVWQTEQHGGLWAVGVGGAATGRGAHLGIIDDPIKDRKEAESETVRTTLRDWYGSTFRTRIEPEAGSIVVVQTRWHEEDLVGQILEIEDSAVPMDREGWHIIDLPAVAEDWEDRPIFPQCITVEEDWRAVGEALCPERYNLRALSRIRASVGEREWAALYQQSPRPAAGNILSPDWWQWYEKPPEQFARIIISVDCTFKDADNSDYVAMVVVGQSGSQFHVIDMVNERLDIVSTMTRLDAKVRQWGPSAVLIEAAANGFAVLQMMKQRIPNMIPISPAAGGSKAVRVQAIAPVVEAGNVFLPRKAPWVETFLNQASSFPAAKNDDMVDAFAQLITWATKRPAFRQSIAAYGYGMR